MSDWRPRSAPTHCGHGPRCRSFGKGAAEPGPSRAARSRPVSAPLPSSHKRRDERCSSRPVSAPFRTTTQRPASAVSEARRRMQAIPKSPFTFDEFYRDAKGRVAQKRLDVLREQKKAMEWSSPWQLREQEASLQDDLLQACINVYEDQHANFKLSREDRKWVKSSLKMLAASPAMLDKHRRGRRAGKNSGMYAPRGSVADEETELMSNGSSSRLTAKIYNSKIDNYEGEITVHGVQTCACTDLSLNGDGNEDHAQQDLVDVMPQKPVEKKIRKFVAVMQYGPLEGQVKNPEKVMRECQLAREEIRSKRIQEEQRRNFNLACEMHTQVLMDEEADVLPACELDVQELMDVERPDVAEEKGDILLYNYDSRGSSSDFLPYSSSSIFEQEDLRPQLADHKEGLHARLSNISNVGED